MSINRVNISGNLTRDPEVRQTSGGTMVMTVGVAVNDRVRDQQTGEWGDRPNFVDCVLFGNRAQALQPILRKGMKVAIEGRLRYSAWERDGQKRSKLEVIVDELELMQARQEPSGAVYGAQGAPAHNPSPAPQTAPQAAAQPPQGAYAAPPAIPAAYGGQGDFNAGAPYDEQIPF